MQVDLSSKKVFKCDLCGSISGKFVPTIAVLKIKDKWISQQHIALFHERKKHDSVIIRGVGRCQILQGHTFSWI